MFPAIAKTDATKLLGDDAQLEMLLQQASTAPSLSAVTALTPQIFAFITTTNADANMLRVDLGLPQATPLPTATANRSVGGPAKRQRKYRAPGVQRG